MARFLAGVACPLGRGGEVAVQSVGLRVDDAQQARRALQTRLSRSR